MKTDAQIRKAKANRRDKLKRLYGLSVEEYDRMLGEQGGVCAICQKECWTGWRLAVDHVPGTNPAVVRGLLCNRCNRGLGAFDDLGLAERMIQYLQNRN